jgi:hypothetical protein
MADYRGTAESALIAGGRDHNHTVLCGLIERLFKRRYAVDGRLRQSEAQVYDARARIDTFDDCRGEFLGRCTRNVFAVRCYFVEYGPYQEGAVRTYGGRWGTSLRRQYSCDKSPMHARRAVGIRARGLAIWGTLGEAFTFKIGVVESNRPIDQPDLQLGAAATAFHQRC